MLERLRVLAGKLHHKINLGEDEPLIRIVLAGYVRDYGPEAWTIDYHIAQDALGNDIWRTRVLRPSYNQLYPPEKGMPKTFMEVRYPPENRATGEPELLDLLQQNDSRLAKIRATNEIQAKSVTLAVQGQSQKSETVGIVNFLKAALPAVAPPQTNLTMAKVEYDGGFQWILQPPRARAASRQPPTIPATKRAGRTRTGPRCGTSLKTDRAEECKMSSSVSILDTKRSRRLPIRLLREEDLPAADRIMRLAFGTFLGLPDPLKFMGDADYVRTRWRADPSAALAAEMSGELVGTNFATRWGSVAFSDR